MKNEQLIDKKNENDGCELSDKEYDPLNSLRSSGDRGHALSASSVSVFKACMVNPMNAYWNS